MKHINCLFSVNTVVLYYRIYKYIVLCVYRIVFIMLWAAVKSTLPLTGSHDYILINVF